MTDVDDALMDLARDLLEVSPVSSLKGGAQKRVELVDRAGESLVMKVIAIGSSTPDALQRAEREVDLLARLDSPHVVRVASELVELDEPVRGAAWLEEALSGQDLGSVLFTGPWTWEQTREMGSQVARGLGAAHQAKVVHRDLSANNVRRLADGSYKVMDFGFARHTLRSGLTIAGQPGTRGYASPEHLNSYSGAPTAASDVFAVGILMYAALAQVLPIDYTGDDADYARRLMRVEVLDIATHRPDLTVDQAAVVRRCLHPQPARRFLNGGAIAAALEALA